MRDLIIDMADFGGVVSAGDEVVLSAPAVRGSSVDPGRLITPQPRTLELVDGVVTVPVEVGPLRVTLKPRGGVLPGTTFETVVPEGEGPITLRVCLEGQFRYDPPVVNRGLDLIEGARDEALGQVEGAVDNALGTYFVPPSTNIFDRTDVMDGWVLPQGSAVPAENPLYVLSYPIPVQGGQEYSFIDMGRLTWLTGEEFVSSSEGGASGTARTATSPAAATHVRLTVGKHLAETAQMNVGATLLPYEPGGTGHVKPGKLPTHLWFDLSPEEIGAQPAGDYLSGQVTPEDTTFFDVSMNMVNLEGIETGVAIPAGQGTVVENSRYSVTAPIPVIAGETYTILYINRVTFFDSGGEYVGHHSITSNPPDTLIAPAQAAYVRLTLGNVNLSTAQMNVGATLLPYQPFGRRRLRAGHLPDITASDVDFIQLSPNLLDVDSLTDKTAIQHSTGEPIENATQALSGWIEVTPGESYTVSPEQPGSIRYAFYDQNRTFLNSALSPAPHTFTAGEGAVWMRVNVASTALDLPLMLNRGASALPYEPYWVEVAGRRIGAAEDASEDNAHDLIFMVDAPGLSEVYTAPTVEAQPDIYATTVEDVYGWYDQLVTDHPTYVSRRDLGMSSDGVHPVYAYTLKPEEVPTTPDRTVNPTRVQPTPTALLMSGTHGYEETGVYSLWRMAKALCEEWEASPVLDAMRWNFEVIIIPLVNPFGWGPETFGRHNANGVDLARNFSTNWRESEPGSTTYGGTAPLSEPEAQGIDALMGEVADRCVFGGSFHNFNGSAETRNMIWQAAASQESMLLGKKLIARMSRKWRSEHDWITVPETYFGYSDLGAPAGSEGRALDGHGILGSTFETAQHCYLDGVGGSKRDTKVMTLGHEAVVNYVAMGLAEGLRLKQ